MEIPANVLSDSLVPNAEVQAQENGFSISDMVMATPAKSMNPPELNLIDFQSPAPVSVESLLHAFESGATPAHLKTPSLSHLLERLNDEPTQNLGNMKVLQPTKQANIMKTPSIERLLAMDDDDFTNQQLMDEGTDMNITNMGNSLSRALLQSEEEDTTLGNLRTPSLAKLLRQVCHCQIN